MTGFIEKYREIVVGNLLAGLSKSENTSKVLSGKNYKTDTDEMCSSWKSPIIVPYQKDEGTSVWLHEDVSGSNVQRMCPEDSQEQHTEPAKTREARRGFACE